MIKKVDPKAKGYHSVQLDDEAYWILQNKKKDEGLSSTSEAIKNLKVQSAGVGVNDKIYDAWTDLTALMKIYCGDQIARLIDIERTLMMMVKDDSEKITFMMGQMDGLMISFRERWPNGKEH